MDANVNERSVMVAWPRGAKISIPQMRQLARLRRLGTRGGSTASCSLEDGEDATTTEQGIRAIPLKYATFSSRRRLG